jgi:mannose-6-phosphate isomerase-like protein (cupin superfamily)
MRPLFAIVAVGLSATSMPAQQSPAPPAVDIRAADVAAFLDALPPDQISDRAIRVADVGGYNVGVFGVFRPRDSGGAAIRHETSVTEVYYMVEGSGTLVTGGIIIEERSTGNSRLTGRPNFAGSGVEGGVSRRVEPGDIVIIPGNSPHWWSSLDSDIKYLIYRPDPEALLEVR